MGLGVVILFWIAVGGVLATLAALFLMGIALLLTRRVRHGRIPAIVAAGALPFACLAWAGAVAISLAIVDPLVFDRDMGFGDEWYVPLPNGYRMQMIDVTDKADICRPRVQDSCTMPSLYDVKNLQISGVYIAGEITGDGNQTTFFLLDTRSNWRGDFKTRQQVAAASHARGFALNLSPVYNIYLDYRMTWLDALGVAAILVPPALGTLLGFLWVLRLRRRVA